MNPLPLHRACSEGCHLQNVEHVTGEGIKITIQASGICKKAKTRVDAKGFTHVTPSMDCVLMASPPSAIGFRGVVKALDEEHQDQPTRRRA